MGATRSVRVCGTAAVLLVAPSIAIAPAHTPVTAVLHFDTDSFGRDRADFGPATPNLAKVRKSDH